MSVEYQVVSPAAGSTICVFSDVPAHGGRTEKVLTDIAAKVATTTLFRRSPGLSAEPEN